MCGQKVVPVSSKIARYFPGTKSYQRTNDKRANKMIFYASVATQHVFCARIVRPRCESAERVKKSPLAESRFERECYAGGGSSGTGHRRYIIPRSETIGVFMGLMNREWRKHARHPGILRGGPDREGQIANPINSTQDLALPKTLRQNKW
jgi:hypothetical protein